VPVHETGSGPPVRRRPAGRAQRRAPSGHDTPLTSAEVARTVGRRARNRQFTTTRHRARGMSCNLATGRRAVGTPPAHLRRGGTNRRRAPPQPTVCDHPAAHMRHVERPRLPPADAPDGPPPSGHDSPLTSAEVARTVGRRARNRQFTTTRHRARGMSCNLATGRRRARRSPAERSRLPAQLRRSRTNRRLPGPRPTVCDHSAMRTRHVVQPRHERPTTRVRRREPRRW
jgi:hypothetical protein